MPQARRAPLRSALTVTAPLSVAGEGGGTKGVPQDFDGLRRVEQRVGYLATEPNDSYISGVRPVFIITRLQALDEQRPGISSRKRCAFIQPLGAKQYG
jgi:hypothetical protein